MAPYEFIHPTKTGGTAVEQLFRRHCGDVISGSGHNRVCKDFALPIVIVREPVDRFLSIFNYWRNGATAPPFTRDAPMKDDIDRFIRRLIRKESKLLSWFITPKHFAPQSLWIDPSAYDRTTVVVYDRHELGIRINRLLDDLGVPPAELQVVNTSRITHAHLTDKQRRWIEWYYHDDFALWNLVHTDPDRFRAVYSGTCQKTSDTM